MDVVMKVIMNLTWPWTWSDASVRGSQCDRHTAWDEVRQAQRAQTHYKSRPIFTSICTKNLHGYIRDVLKYITGRGCILRSLPLSEFTLYFFHFECLRFSFARVIEGRKHKMEVWQSREQEKEAKEREERFL